MRHSGSFGVDLVRIEEAPPSLKSYVLMEGLTLGNEIPQSDEYIFEASLVLKYAALISRIRRTLFDVDQEYNYAKEQAGLAEETKQAVYWTAVGLSMHGYYTGLEKIFKIIVDTVDGGLMSPQTGQWYKDLLDQVMLDVLDTRPPVIDEKTRMKKHAYVSMSICLFDT